MGRKKVKKEVSAFFLTYDLVVHLWALEAGGAGGLQRRGGKGTGSWVEAEGLGQLL